MDKNLESILQNLPCGNNETLGSSGRILKIEMVEERTEVVLNGYGLDFNEKILLEKAIKETGFENKATLVVRFQDEGKKNKITVEKVDPKKVQKHVEENAVPKETSTSGLDKVKHIIAVGSGKGGVGKSSVSVYLAIALKEAGYKVGIMDADIYGPSIPRMLGVRENKVFMTDDKKLVPVETSSGIRTISFGFFSDEKEAVIWRGPMLHNVVKQFLNDVAWGELDYLIIDLPPGTGDVQLSLSQTIPLHGAVIVTTPQMIAVSDATKAISMFQKVRVPILGIVENMTHLITENGKKYEIFGKGGADHLAKEFNLKVLGRIPLAVEICESLDAGNPFTLNNPLDPVTQAFLEIAKNIEPKKEGFLSKLKQKLL